MNQKKRIVIALGGNAIQNKGERGGHDESLRNVSVTMKDIAKLILDTTNEVVITHGNGPQVGNIILQNAAAAGTIPAMPLFVCDAMSQGQIGFWMQQALTNILSEQNNPRDVATIITQVVVDKNDSAFQNPSKPIGPFYSKGEAEKIMLETAHILREDSGRGWRRVVPSPEPLAIAEIETIRELMNNGKTVIAAGGGGIPVTHENGIYAGIDAVIDKDRAGALLGNLLNADLFIILTAVEKVCLHFGTPDETPLHTISSDEAKKYLSQGHFAAGSMKPKIEAALKFLGKDCPHRKVLISKADCLPAAMAGKTGTWITY